MNNRLLSKAWESLRKHSSALLHGEELFNNEEQINSEEQIEILPPLKKTSQPESHSVQRPHQQRTAQVFESLDQASLEGLTNYKDLIDYVSQKTGKGCSKKLIAKWKKERGLALKNHSQEEAKPDETQTDHYQTEVKPDSTQADHHQTEAKSDETSLPAQEKPQFLPGKLTVAAIAIGIGLIAIGVMGSYRDRSQPQTAPQTSLSVPTAHQARQAHNSNSPKQLKFNLSLSSPKDLKVKEGDTVSAGEVVARRIDEESRLVAERQALTLEYQKLQAKDIPTPIAPIPVPTVKTLPPISYTEEEAAIAAAAMNIQQAQRAFQLQQEKLKTEPLEESAAVQRAAVEVQNRQRLVNNQHRKIDAVALMKNLPPAVAIHEQAVLKKREAELQQAEAEYQQAQAKLSAASSAQTEKLQQLGAGVEKARADHQLAIAKLQTKKDQRAYVEYEASVAAARWAQEQNQTVQNYSRQLLEAEQQKRERWFQLAQIQAKIDEIDKKLLTTSVITSPYSGVIKKIKIVQQDNDNLSAQFTLHVDDAGSPSTGAGDELFTNANSPVR